MEGRHTVESYFKFAERGTDLGTEIRAGITTFMVMVYIVALNGIIIAEPLGLDPVAVAAGTALVAGVMTIAMGVFTNYPFALAAGLGLNAVVAFGLTAIGMTPAQAMGVVVIEGVIITVLVLVGLREAIMDAIPISLKRAIGVGIGLFILFIGFWDGGILTGVGAPNDPVDFIYPNSAGAWVFLIGLLITAALWARKVKGALIISIALTTVVAIVLGVQKLPTEFSATPNFDTLGLGLQDLGGIFTIQAGLLAALLAIFTLMISDFFDTMGTVTGVAAEAGLSNEDGSVPGVGRVLLIDGLAAAVGGAAGVSSNTTYIESAAGVADGGRTGMTSVVTGALFLVAVFLAPIVQIIPLQAAAPALVLVGYLMFTQIGEIDARDFTTGFPALLTMILMPLTFTITIGIGAGVVAWVVLQIVHQRWSEIHWLMWIVFIAFLLYFAQEAIKPWLG
ncbi:MAG: NCS2 family permease [Chloroflexota bacterium]|nr:NCS2 family permease [Chloroflexota bacterium]